MHTPIPADLDLTVPSYRGAYHIARNKAFESAKGGGRDKPNADDCAAADHLFLRLLYLVEGDAGGLLGLDDHQLVEKLSLLGARFTSAMAAAALYEPIQWPAISQKEAA